MQHGINTEIKLRVDWADLDLFGHVNNVAFFRYVQAARVSFCESIGLSSVDPLANPGFMVASSACQFRSPLRYPSEIKLRLHVAWIKNTSFQLEYAIEDSRGQVVAEAADVIVVYDHCEKHKLDIPADVRRVLEMVERTL